MQEPGLSADGEEGGFFGRKNPGLRCESKSLNGGFVGKKLCIAGRHE